MLAISTDDAKTLGEFRAKYAPGVRFVADPEAKLVTLFDVKTPVVSFAQRTTFIIGQDRKIVAVQTGNDAIDAAKALDAVHSCGG